MENDLSLYFKFLQSYIVKNDLDISRRMVKWKPRFFCFLCILDNAQKMGDGGTHNHIYVDYELQWPFFGE